MSTPHDTSGIFVDYRRWRPITAVVSTVVIVLAGAAVAIWWSQRPDPPTPPTAFRPRGQIVVNDRVIAQSEPAANTYRRSYSTDLYVHAIGFAAGYTGVDAGVEKSENEFLSAEPAGRVRLTLVESVQTAALAGLDANRRGAVVALDPRTGAILAMASAPRFDANRLTADAAQAQAAFRALHEDKNAPLINRALSATEPPGGVFEVVAATAALGAGLTPDTQIPGGASYQLPGTTLSVRNSTGTTCPDTLTIRQALAFSCHTAFARLCAERLAADQITAAAASFGFGTALALVRDDDRAMPVAESRTGSMPDSAALAMSCIGQRDVRMTPLHAAMIAACIANDGIRLRPYLIGSLRAGDKTVYEAQPQPLGQVVSRQSATNLRDMMRHTVTDGVARSARIDGAQVGAMTGVSQNTDDAGHGWFIGFAVRNGTAVVAVAVLLQDTGPGGSQAAIRLGRDVMQAALKAGQQ